MSGTPEWRQGSTSTASCKPLYYAPFVAAHPGWRHENPAFKAFSKRKPSRIKRLPDFLLTCCLNRSLLMWGQARSGAHMSFSNLGLSEGLLQAVA
ncbi:MAG: hypothetical protein ACRETW_11075, partial [Stenotrophobium sp.]